MDGTEEAAATANGHARDSWRATNEDIARVADRAMFAMRNHAAELRGLLEVERETISKLGEWIDAARDRERRLGRALSALEGKPAATSAPTAAPAPARAQKQKQQFKNWRVGNQKVEDAFAALASVDGGEANVSQVAKAGGMSAETARRALVQLREAERVRITRVDKVRGTFFVVMPGAQ